MNAQVLVILDGSMGHFLKQSSSNLPFLSGSFLCIDDPNVVIEAHLDYIKAGASVITTNSYGVTNYYLDKYESRYGQKELITHAALCAREAVRRSGVKAFVAGCMPPLQESYRRLKPLSREAVAKESGEIAGLLKPHVDIILCETMSSIDEAVGATEAAIATGLPVWVSFSLEDSLDVRLRSKESLVDAVQKVLDCGPIEAFLLNCCTPRAISAALPILAESAKGRARIGCYPNIFQTTTTEWLGGKTSREFTNPGDFDAEGIMLPDCFARFAQDWLHQGAGIVGGCCGTTPAHIECLKTLFEANSGANKSKLESDS